VIAVPRVLVKLTIALLAAGVVCLGPAVPSGLAAHDPSARKFVQLGWEIPSTSYLRENWRTMEANAPFDGVIFSASAAAEGSRRVSTQSMWDGRAWQREWFAKAVADLKSCAFTKFTENFVRVNANPGGLEWSDEDGWRVLADKAGIVGWLVRQTGTKGVCIDFESYGEPQFRYDPETGRSFGETAAMARKRGAQFMDALAAECPSATVLALWLNSINLNAGEAEDPPAILAIGGQGLLPAFVDGMLDAIPPEMTLVDGCESAYRFDGAGPYLRAYNRIRRQDGPAERLVSPENRRKYRSQVQVAFGVYLDAYLNPESSRWYIGGKGGTRLARLQHNLSVAREASDRYVWIYGEQCRWWPVPGNWYEDSVSETPGRGRAWEEAMPGVSRAILWARDPLKPARAEIARRREAGALANLAANPGFESPEQRASGAPKGWAAWQREGSDGTFSVDREGGSGSRASARAERVRDGCLLQQHRVRPGETYVVEAECLPRGLSSCRIRVSWKDAEGKWLHGDVARDFTFAPGETEWQRAFGVVGVPDGAASLLLLLCVEHQVGGGDVCWFDNVGVYAY
jgi:hypothetical protein